MDKKTGRPGKWRGPTKAIRVPEQYAEQLLAVARQMEAAAQKKPRPPAEAGPILVSIEDPGHERAFVVLPACPPAPAEDAIVEAIHDSHLGHVPAEQLSQRQEFVLAELVRQFPLNQTALSADFSPPQPEPPADIQAALSELVERYRSVSEGREAQIKEIVWPPLKQPLYESCMSRKYSDIQLALTGHHTNELCAGIFSQIREADRELLLWMLLAELLEAVARPTGGSVFPPLYGQSEIESGQKLAGLKMD